MPCEVAPLILASRARAGPAPPVPRDGQCGRERTTRTARRDVASQRVFALNGATGDGDGDGWGERDGAREGGKHLICSSTACVVQGRLIEPDAPKKKVVFCPVVRSGSGCCESDGDPAACIRRTRIRCDSFL
jgi:hypothetical protein